MNRAQLSGKHVDEDVKPTDGVVYLPLSKKEAVARIVTFKTIKIGDSFELPRPSGVPKTTKSPIFTKTEEIQDPLNPGNSFNCKTPTGEKEFFFDPTPVIPLV